MYVRRCEECGTRLPCVDSCTELCRECNEELSYCYNACPNPCRTKDEQRRIFDKIKPGWNN